MAAKLLGLGDKGIGRVQDDTDFLKFTFVDMFAGIGGFHEALKQIGGTCVAACEIDDRARQTYLANHNIDTSLFFKDIHDIDASKIPDHDLLCAGFPCQPFSISGRRQSLDDKRSKVINPLFKIIAKKLPKIVMLENVKHIQHINKGEVFHYIINSLEKLGYMVSYKLLNAKDFGVAQNRERWIFIGVKAKQKFDFPNIQNKQVILRDILEEKAEFAYLKEPYTLIKTPKMQASGLLFCGYRNKKLRGSGVRQGTKHLSRVHKQPNRIYSINGVHPTIPSQELSGRFWILLDDGRVRKLTPTECFRLMGFDDNFIKPSVSGNLYQQIGNSVCVPMIRKVSVALFRHMRYEK